MALVRWADGSDIRLSSPGASRPVGLPGRRLSDDDHLGSA
jgi:hypothetical protein